MLRRSGCSAALTVLLAACAVEQGIEGVPDDCDVSLEFTEVAAANEAANLLDLASPDTCAANTGWCCAHHDWIEIQNTDPERTVSLEGYTIAVSGDAPPHPFSAAELAPLQRLIVVAAPSMPRPGSDPLCDEVVGALFPGYGFAGTDLDRDGGTGIRLLGPDGSVCRGLDYQDQHADLSDSLQEDDDWCLTFPTPGLANGPCLDGGDR